ncbi:MAG: bifunctional phosphoribosyl-AMP cyclohydrolase/phosphoribosyl-ATP diphosphatase HisIE [Gemmatimonadaceae bacterium]
MLDLATLDFEKGGGLVTVVTQDMVTGVVLTVAHADRTALERTIATGEMHYRSRSRGLWHKGATSGNVQRVVSLDADCDRDAVLARVKPAGPACHTGSRSCFGEIAVGADALGVLARTIATRVTLAAGEEGELARSSYTVRLLSNRNLRLKKLGEEAAELVVACADGDGFRAREEGLDLLYHTLVALAALGVSLDDIRHVAEARSQSSRR